MSKKATIQNAAIIVLAVAIIVMSVGYAAFNTNLNINGDATIQAANWDVHFENIVPDASNVKLGSVTKGAQLNGNTTVEFEVSLVAGEEYSFTVDAVNNGTFDAKLTSSILTVTKEEEGQEAVTSDVVGANYNDGLIEYTVIPVNVNSILDKKNGSTPTSKTYTVTVKALTNNNGSAVSITETDYSFKLKLVYEQV